jgi:hypothetical protein
MKKLVFLSVSVVLALSSVNAQVVPVSPLAEGVKLLNYEKSKSALAFFKEALDKNPTNTENIFWYGEIFQHLKLNIKSEIKNTHHRIN